MHPLAPAVDMNLQDLYPTFASHCNQKIYATPRFGIFFLFEKENACKIKAKGLSQEELAVKLNVVRQTVSKWEQGGSLR